ncbi:hypothetical protein EYF80_054920 [Liparis tanakae]|uniref:Uncharacterized protein n=1 Tax=Liparis tanakae TaxID=230148 RepID=A0A4Z2F134_9TELE|nr:hypothetical protein EYF80_054920 [Liparis tanakae]
MLQTVQKLRRVTGGSDYPQLPEDKGLPRSPVLKALQELAGPHVGLQCSRFLTTTQSLKYRSGMEMIPDAYMRLPAGRTTILRAPWYTCELHKMKTAGRVIERRLEASGLTVHKQAYREHRKAYAEALRDAQSKFYSTIINNSPGNSKQLFSTVNHLIKPLSLVHPEATEDRCNMHITFFRQS